MLLVGCTVTGVWAVAVLVQVFSPAHVVPTEVHAIMLTVAAGFFGGAALAAKRNGNGKGNGP